MYLIFGMPAVARGIAYVALLLFLVLLLLKPPSGLDWQHLIGLVGQAVSYTSIALWVIGRWAWRPAWHVFPCLERIIYPDLNGCWRGIIQSNWPVIEAMANAAAGQKDDFDAVAKDYSAAIKAEVVPVTIRIWANWFRIAMRLESDGGYSESETRAIAPIRGGQGNLHRLAYLFENRTRDPKATDVSCHDGAAYVSIILGTPKRLEGVYWTNRGWQRGFNTAGLIDLQLVDRNPDTKLTLADREGAPAITPN